MLNLFRDIDILKKNPKTDMSIPNVPSAVIEILFDRNILNIVEIARISNVEIVNIIPFFINALIYFFDVCF